MAGPAAMNNGGEMMQVSKEFLTRDRVSARKLLLAAASSAMALAIAAPVAAQTAPASTTPDADQSAEIVVTGIRGGLQRNLDIKR